MLEDDGLVQILTAVVLLASCLLCLVRALRKISPVLHWAQLSFEVTLEENMEFGAAIMIFMILLRYPLSLRCRRSESLR